LEDTQWGEFVKNVPEELARQLRERARRHHRSLQGELMVILEEAVWGDRRRLRPEEVHRRVRELGLRTEAEAVEMVREDRDGR